ncbi:MAG TPA: VWA domain-containing protein [Thermoanaerobaculia bacterium]|nr:VWA domain-containing protein [Thermoanaerobaculia bacterium]
MIWSWFAEPRLVAVAALAPLAAALLAAWLWRRRLAADAAWAARGLWSRLMPTWSPGRLRFSIACLALAVLGASLALARPRWGAGQEEVERRGVDVVFVVDSSLSMGVLDVAPSRLYVAKALVRRMARAMPGNRIGLVQTEGTGVVLAPLTLDGAVVDLLLDTMEPGSLPTPGTELAPGLDAALRLFGEGSEKHRVLVLLSDGEDHGGGMEQEIAKLRDGGVVVHAFGLGTPSGSPVPIPGTNNRKFKRQSDGSLVISRLHEDVLEQLARSTGGSYTRVTSAAADPTPVLHKIDRMEKRTIESQVSSHLAERFQWPLGLAVAALLLHLAVGPFARSAAAETALPDEAGRRRAA